MRFADVLREKRRAAGLTQRQVAQRLNVTETCVYYWETARSIPGLGNLVGLEAALNVERGELLVAAAYGSCV
jgi:transcriptional regulator with XRE-family HTH domain